MKPVVGIFAHPDDEAFGPAGTLAKFAKEERDVYLICVTDGDAGLNSSDQTQNLSQIRREELLASSKCLGIKQVFFLDYPDGTLNNNVYHEIAEKIQKILDDLNPEIIITMEPRGVTGHLDHVAVSLITTYVFKKIAYATDLWYFCLTEEARSLYSDYYIYFPPGYSASEITKVIDVNEFEEQRNAACLEHHSQKHDMDKLLHMRKQLPSKEYFITLNKDMA